MGGRIDERFYSLKEVAHILSGPRPEDAASHKKNEGGFISIDYNTSCILATTGDYQSLSQIEKKAESVQVRTVLGNSGRGRKIRKDVTGDDVDMGLFLHGEPECCRNTFRDAVPNKLVSFLYVISASAYISEDTLNARGLALASIIKALEIRGYSTQFDALYVTGEVDLRVRVKNFGEYVNPAVAAYYTSNAAALRRTFFRLAEEAPMELRRRTGAYTNGGGYGHPSNITEIPDRTVYFPTPTDNAGFKHFYDKAKLNLECMGILIE